MSDLFGNHIVGFPMRRLNCISDKAMADQCQVIEHPSDLRVGYFSPVDSSFEGWARTVER